MTITINFITVINQWDPKTSYKNLCKFVSCEHYYGCLAIINKSINRLLVAIKTFVH